MRDWKYKILLYFLRGLIYAKRVLVFLLKSVWQAIVYLYQFLRRTIGFRIYKLIFKSKQLTGRISQPFSSRLKVLFSKRMALEMVLFLVIVAIAYPQSILYSASNVNIPGRGTLLYKIAGPGYQDFSLEEVEVNTIMTVPRQETDQSWRSGAVSIQTANSPVSHSFSMYPGISSISAGGGALVKPNIFPNATFPVLNGISARMAIIYHTVQPGETAGQIANNYGLSMVTILWANNLTNYSYIRPGQQLKILPVSGLLHKVKKGETVAKIAKTYNTQPEKIIKFNKLKEDGSDMVVGEDLIIPDGVKPTPVYVAPSRYYPDFSNVAAPPSSANSPLGSGYIWPTTVRRITQYFGWRHTGVDIAGPAGNPVYAARSGVVIKSQCGWNSGYGCYIIIDHGNGVQTVYGHNSRLYVFAGEGVEQGQTISLMGSTGRSTGSHLHFEVRIGGRRVNPLQYIR